ncbi:MAG: cation:proton antiporter [Leptolinea sp.]|jgi:Kef-type K+ transport system membrane component KefB|nr:cation:proton antiporter [Leptolinea sp.]
MSVFLQLILSLIIILSAAKIAGYLSTRLGQPSVFGELLIGIILGPSLINLANLPFITDLHLLEMIDNLGEIGVLLLMFLAGIELHLRDLAKSSRVAMYAGTLGVVFPVVLGYLCGIATGMDQSSALFLGLTLAATSVSISAQTLMELGYLRTRVGYGLLGAAVYDDILVILLLSIFIAVLGGNFSFVGFLLLVGRMLLYFILAGVFGYFFLPRLLHRIEKSTISQGLLTFSLVILLIYGLAAELIGEMAAITGTFFAGVFFSRCVEKEQVIEGMHNIAYGFFVPVFFVSIGLKTDLHSFSLTSLGLLLILILVAIISKILGAGLGGLAGGLSWLESIQLGTGMISRGEVGLILASIGAKSGLIDADILTDIVVIILVSTLVTPPLLKFCFTNLPSILTAKTGQTIEKKQVESDEVE